MRSQPIATPQQIVALTHSWLAAVCRRNPSAVAALYAPDGVLVGTVAQRIKQGRSEIKTYFDHFLRKDGICGRFTSDLVQTYPGWAIHSGTYAFAWREAGRAVAVPARFTFVWRLVPGEGWKIATHHSSALPKVA